MLFTLFTIFASSFVIALSGALMPGPLLTATISESSRRGFWAGPLMIAGHAILELALVVALSWGFPVFSDAGGFAKGRGRGHSDSMAVECWCLCPPCGCREGGSKMNSTVLNGT